MNESEIKPNASTGSSLGAHHALSLAENGYFLVVVAAANHPELGAVLRDFGRPDYLVTYDPAEIAQIPDGVERVGILAEANADLAILNELVERCWERFPDILVYNGAGVAASEDDLEEIGKACNEGDGDAH